MAVRPILVLSLACVVNAAAQPKDDPAPKGKGGISAKPVGFKLQLDVVSDGYDGKTCWFHPRAGAIPGATPTVVLTMQKWDIKASDLFLPVQSQESKNLGKSWTPVVEHADTLGRRPEANGVVVGVCDFTPKWHAASKTLLGTGHTVRYKDDKLIPVRPREAVWSAYDPAKKTWSKWDILKMPDDPKWWNSGAGSTQRVDLENGDVLLPLYAKPRDAKAYFTTVARCRFDGKELKFEERTRPVNSPQWQIVHLRQQIVEHRAAIKDLETRIAVQRQRRGEATAGPGSPSAVRDRFRGSNRNPLRASP
ncbi:sialidase family protein [Urbifossiella limnaea]|uniref:DUF3304 domain-containing protein n=1 Tax=Urbifossiella limnaea TaxID=2528023 RepID=A0A517XQP0_9BACT|nr:sialidase family protein [Urbifossiella limnaea]QDU19821.1 hypothetical protein ETAA1_17590 [Urbifossiella limnaea]